MNEIILTLLLVSHSGMTTQVYHYDEQHMTCEEAGEQLLRSWHGTGTKKYMVSGYICDHANVEAEVNSTILPFVTIQED